MNLGELWWDRIANAKRFIDDILNDLYLGQSVLINFPEYIPWNEEFKEILENRLASYGDERAFDVFSASKAKYPGKFLFDTYCNPNEKHKYWMTETYEEFLAKSKASLLSTKYVCIEDVFGTSSNLWTETIERYLNACEKDAERGIFILLNNGQMISSSKKLKTYNYIDYISDYDGLMLCLTIASDLPCGTKEKQYIAEFANLISNGDYELAGTLALKGAELIENPYKAVRDAYVDSGKSYKSLTKQTDSALWEAQIKIVFPIIEAYRKFFSEKYKEVLESFLPFWDNKTNQKIFNVNELEVGHLYYLCEKHGFAEKSDYERLGLIREIRNDASHWNIIDIYKLRKIFK